MSHDGRTAAVCNVRVPHYRAVHKTLRRLNLKKQTELPDTKTTEEGSEKKKTRSHGLRQINKAQIRG